MKRIAVIASLATGLAAIAIAVLVGGVGNVESAQPKASNPNAYGSILLNKKTADAGMPGVVFPHWWHRSQFTCKVCHTDIGFPMKAGETDFVMAEIFSGNQCGKCHNGTIAFSPMDDCNRCHSQGVDVPQNRKIETALAGAPPDPFGNKINWVKALDQKKITPKASLDGTGEMMVVDMDIEIPVTKFTPHPPNVIYPHKAHTELLDCSTCHTSIFNMQKGGNPEMSMMKIAAGQYCGVCHGKVAFPLEDCFRCHSKDVPLPAQWK